MQLKCHRGPLIAALISCASVATGTAETRDRVTRVLPFEPGVPIRVDASIADVTITGSNRPDVLVDVVRRELSQPGQQLAHSLPIHTLAPARRDFAPM